VAQKISSERVAVQGAFLKKIMISRNILLFSKNFVASPLVFKNLNL